MVQAERDEYIDAPGPIEEHNFPVKMKRHPDCLASGPGRPQQKVQHGQQRIDRSVYNTLRTMNTNSKTHKNEDPVSILLARSTTLLSSSSEVLE